MFFAKTVFSLAITFCCFVSFTLSTLAVRYTKMHQLVGHRTGIVEVMGSNPIGASEFVQGFICN